MKQPEVASACINACQVAADACSGCGRRLDDIAAWSGAGSGERIGILLQAARRLADGAPRPWPRRVRDGLGNELLLAGPPQRIVSLVPSQTELLFDLGAGERVVGVTKFCVHPAQARASRRSVGGTKRRISSAFGHSPRTWCWPTARRTAPRTWLPSPPSPRCT